MGKNDIGILLLGLGALYLISKNFKKNGSGGGSYSTYIYSYSGYLDGDRDYTPEPPPAGSNIPESLKGFKTPAQAIKYAPSGAGTVLHGTGTIKSGGGYQIR